MKIIDGFLNNITMYRLVLYFLLVALGWALFLSFYGILPFSPLTLIFSTSFIVVVCWIINKSFSFFFKAPTNAESAYITALILSLIITPSIDHNLPVMFWSAVLASASKFILAINKKHVFNPAAIGVLITGLGVIGAASWWVGTAAMMPVVLIGGLLIVKKIDRLDLVLSFFAISVPIILILSYLQGNGFTGLIRQIFLDSPILFFAFVMLTEPLTSPSGKIYRILYGGLVGVLFTPLINLGTFYITPEMALVLGNLFSYLVSPKERLILKLQQKTQLAPNIYDFVFSADRKLAFLPGQYLEWTLGYKDPDIRGNRRYFTVASSPTENTLRIAVRVNNPSSSYKEALIDLKVGDEIIASSLGGEFILPDDKNEKFCFIAGGIGITPYRSMIKNMIDKNETRDIILLYSVRNVSDAVYMDIFREAEHLGVKTIITLTDTKNIPADWQGGVGMITREIIEKVVPDYKERVFYLSGSHGMVTDFEKTLSQMGLSKSKIRIDYFTGY